MIQPERGEAERVGTCSPFGQTIATRAPFPGFGNRCGQLFKDASALAVRLRMSSIWSVDWKPMIKASTVPSPRT